MLLDHPIRPRQHVRRNRQADLLGGFQIDDQLELLWLLHWEISGLGALEDFVHIRSRAPERVVRVCCIAHKPTSFDKFWRIIYAASAGRSSVFPPQIATQ